MPIDSSKVNNQGTAPQSNSIISNKQFGSHSSFAMSKKPSTLTEGQVLHGEITDLRNNEVTITLTDNTTIIGNISDNSNLYIGQTTSFKITDISPRQITLECLVDNFSDRQDITILKALDEADIPKTDRNKQMVQELLAYRMPINKQMLQQMTQQLAAIKGTSISTLVIMNKYNMTVTPEMAQQFECYRTGDHSLLQGIDNVSEELPDLLDALSKNGSPSDVADFGESLMSIISNHINVYGHSDISLNASIFTAPERNELIKYINSFNEINPDIISEKYTSNQLTTLTASIADGTAPIEDINSIVNIINASEIKSSDILNILNKLDIAIEYLSTNNNDLSQIMDQNERNEFIDKIKDMKLSPELISSMRKGNVSVEHVFTAIQESISEATTHAKESAAELFSTDIFHKFFKNIIKNIWTLSPRDLNQSNKLQDYYKLLVDDLQKTTSLIENNLSGTYSESLSRQTSNMNDNVNFMQQLNQMFSYVQIPLRLHEQTVHSDLYVYTKKNELKHHPEKISVLLHLDLKNIGALDIHITKSNNKVDANFYCPDDFSVKLFEVNMNLLSDSLNELGYLFNANITRSTKENDIVEEFISQNNSDTPKSSISNISRYAFDIRA